MSAELGCSEGPLLPIQENGSYPEGFASRAAVELVTDQFPELGGVRFFYVIGFQRMGGGGILDNPLQCDESIILLPSYLPLKVLCEEGIPNLRDVLARYWVETNTNGVVALPDWHLGIHPSVDPARLQVAVESLANHRNNRLPPILPYHYGSTESSLVARLLGESQMAPLFDNMPITGKTFCQLQFILLHLQASDITVPDDLIKIGTTLDHYLSSHLPTCFGPAWRRTFITKLLQMKYPSLFPNQDKLSNQIHR